VLYVLDEPSIGLHPRDHHRLLETLKQLRDLGNTVIVVEHDWETILSADWIVDFGPLAGDKGGRIVAEGPPAKIKANKNSLTGRYLKGKSKVFPEVKYRKLNLDQAVQIHKASKHNLKDIDVLFPLGGFIVVSGVSGSGKSSLVMETLYPALKKKLSGFVSQLDGCQDLTGWEEVDKVVVIDQSPIGRTPRSNPATYTKAFDPIRQLFALLPEAQKRGYKPGRFSFNVKGGRCEYCRGEGQIKISMQFLSDVYVTCEKCHGSRYHEETLKITYKGKNIAEVLDMTVDKAYDFFKRIPQIERKLKTLQQVGLGYIKLGQPATTLSGGEAQRIKLSAELAKKATGKTVYILDEPTTGLHFADIDKLLHVLHRLVDQGNTVIVIEHNLDVVKTADWLIDLGPEGGEAGGQVIFAGPVKNLIKSKKSYTAQFLGRYFKRVNQL
ncbi:MAG: ATP-binding cassette domain-containing protein, partial [bacterium]|nr:ATP-binding cassette domain-containing protein [bacterium]